MFPINNKFYLAIINVAAQIIQMALVLHYRFEEYQHPPINLPV
jgi:hypothetical protein